MAEQGRRGKRPDKRPARGRYWMYRKLEAHKVRNLVRYNGMSKNDAIIFWRDVRKTRVKGL